MHVGLRRGVRLGLGRSPGGGELEGEAKALGDEHCCATHDVGGRELSVPVDDDLDRLPVVAGCLEREAVLRVDRVRGGSLDKGRHQDPQDKRHAETSYDLVRDSRG